MSIEPLYSLKKLSDASGMTVEYLRGLIERGELAIVRSTPRGQIFVAESAWTAWQQAHVVGAKDPKSNVVPLNPPKRAPSVKAEPFDVDSLLPKDFKKPFPRSQAS
jgi:hypothetical protein